MPVVVVESSVAAPRPNAELIATLVSAVEELLAVTPPTQVRLRLVHVDPGMMAVGSKIGDPGEPWLVVWCSILEGRPEERVTRFITEFAGVVAAAYGVEARVVRVLVNEYAKMHWGIGQKTAAALGR